MRELGPVLEYDSLWVEGTSESLIVDRVGSIDVDEYEVPVATHDDTEVEEDSADEGEYSEEDVVSDAKEIDTLVTS